MSTAFSTLRQHVGRLMGMGMDAQMVMGTPTGTYTTTGFAAAGLGPYATSFFVDWWLRFYAGTHKDTTKKVTAFTTTTGLFVFTDGVSGNVDATDLFELHRDYDPRDIDAALNLAIRMVEKEALGKKVDESLVVNDLLTDGLMEVWTNSSTLTNWTTAGTGTLARESTIKREGTYSAKLSNQAGSDFSIYQVKGNYPLYAGNTNVKASLYARVCCMTADRVRLQLEDGVNTWNSDYHNGHGWREDAADPWLKIENAAISTAATQVKASFRIETGAAIDAYVDKMWLVCGEAIYEYTLPTGFWTVESVYQEQSTIGRFSSMWNRLDPERQWQPLINGDTKKLWIDPGVARMTNGRRLRLEGQAKASTLALDADTTPIDASYLVQQAKALLHQSRIGQGADSAFHEKQYAIAQARADRERRSLLMAKRGFIVDT